MLFGFLPQLMKLLVPPWTSWWLESLTPLFSRFFAAVAVGMIRIAVVAYTSAPPVLDGQVG